jgi:hypothetical protein
MSDELERLAEADGATFIRSATGAWWARDKDGMVIVRGALSKAEAVVLYCEDRDLVGSTPEAILAFIRHQFRPYDSMPEFEEGFQACRRDGALRADKYDGVAGQAYDRGGLAAVQYKRAVEYLASCPDDVERAGPGWLSRLLRMGRV